MKLKTAPVPVSAGASCVLCGGGSAAAQGEGRGEQGEQRDAGGRCVQEQRQRRGRRRSGGKFSCGGEASCFGVAHAWGDGRAGGYAGGGGGSLCAEASCDEDGSSSCWQKAGRSSGGGSGSGRDGGRAWVRQGQPRGRQRPGCPETYASKRKATSSCWSSSWSSSSSSGGSSSGSSGSSSGRSRRHTGVCCGSAVPRPVSASAERGGSVRGGLLVRVRHTLHRDEQSRLPRLAPSI
jgi:hypothetical protein